LVRLRQRLVAREEVVKQLNRRLVELERAKRTSDARSGGSSDIRLAALETELHQERRARAAAERRVLDLLAQLEQLRSADEPLDGDPPG
jgi:predicted  nucleic acid-binding Zn-ribbon protein